MVKLMKKRQRAIELEHLKLNVRDERQGGRFSVMVQKDDTKVC